jgi:PRTRC genetic system protein A
MPIDTRDKILQQQCPAMMVPRFGQFEPLTENGHRFLVASNGLWLEVTRPWLHLITHVAECDMPLPYGIMGADCEYRFDARALSQYQTRFVLDARAALPNECAACITFDDRNGELTYHLLESINATPGGVRYKRPMLAEHHWLILDMHSHGALPAFFSAQDDEDDQGEVKLALVAGTVDKEPSFAMRLCAMGTIVNDGDSE